MKAVLTILAAVISITSAFGLAEENVGPDSSRSHPTTEQSGWPKGIVDLFRHDSRVYSMWVTPLLLYHLRPSLES